ncbi:MAG: glycogen synthase GlgA [Gemmataceae bacterium]|nr:glycogen synthase GlgA [Gemmataceae bacterium]
MRCLYVASEVAGFAKTGGLADVAGSLPRALAQRGHEVAVLLPLYRAVRTGGHPLQPTGLTFGIPFGNRLSSGSIWLSTLPDSDVRVYLIEQPHYFERDDPARGNGLYQFTDPEGRKRDYPDNAERFIFFDQAVLEALRLLDWWPDVLHLNDWQTGLIPVYLRELYPRHPNLELRARYQQIKVLFTLHNMAYQGVFWHHDMPLTGLPWRLFDPDYLEFHGHLNYLKGGIVFSDLINTVSPTYAREIQTPYFGCGLHGVLAQRARRLFGIVNGVDYRTWSPATDAHLSANYDSDTVTEGKPLCKRELQRQYGLAEESRAPLLGMVSRLVDQKGVDLVIKVAPALIEQGAQLVVLGEGDPQYHQLLLQLRERHPQAVGVTLGQNEELAHRIEAGVDVFLMPSLFEPCGLSQLYSLKYGTVPVVRATGGLCDTVADATPERLAAGTATGFSFIPDSPAAFLQAVERALRVYRHDPERWLALMRTGMGQDWSWARSAAEYERLYRRMVEGA